MQFHPLHDPVGVHRINTRPRRNGGMAYETANEKLQRKGGPPPRPGSVL